MTGGYYGLEILGVGDLRAVVTVVARSGIARVFYVASSFYGIFSIISQSVPRLTVGRTTLRVTPVAFSYSVTLLVVNVAFSTANMFRPGPPVGAGTAWSSNVISGRWSNGIQGPPVRLVNSGINTAALLACFKFFFVTGSSTMVTYRGCATSYTTWSNGEVGGWGFFVRSFFVCGYSFVALCLLLSSL